MKTEYVFHVRKSRDLRQNFAPFSVACVSSDAPRLEGTLVCGLESEAEAEAIIADLQGIIRADAQRDAARIDSVEQPEPNRVVRIDSIGRPIHDHPRQSNGKWRTIRRWDDRQRGAVLVEMAIALIVLLTVICGGFDMAMCASAKSSTAWIAREAANNLAMIPGYNVSGYAASAAAGVGLNPANLSCSPSGPAAVTCSYTYNALFFAWPPTLTLSATAVAR
jgi:hypothetical protein